MKLVVASPFLRSACLIVVIVNLRLRQLIIALLTSNLAVISRPSTICSTSSLDRILEASAITKMLETKWEVMRRPDPLVSTNLKSTTTRASMILPAPKDNHKLIIERSLSLIFQLLRQSKRTIVVIVLNVRMLWPLAILLTLIIAQLTSAITNLSVIRTQRPATITTEEINKSKGNRTKCFNLLLLNVPEPVYRLLPMLPVRDRHGSSSLASKNTNKTRMKR